MEELTAGARAVQAAEVRVLQSLDTTGGLGTGRAAFTELRRNPAPDLPGRGA